MRQQVLENYIYFVFSLLIFFPLLRTTCSPLPIIPHCLRPNSTLPPVYLFQEDERALSGTLQNSKFSVSLYNNHNKQFLLLHSPCRYICLSLQAVTLNYSKCRTCPSSWPHHRQFTALDSVPCLAGVKLFIGFSPPNSTCVWGFSWSSRQVKVAGNRGGLQHLHVSVFVFLRNRKANLPYWTADRQQAFPDSNTVIPRLTKIIRSGIAFVRRNLR